MVKIRSTIFLEQWQIVSSSAMLTLLVLNLCCTKHGPQTNNISNTWKIIRNVESCYRSLGSESGFSQDPKVIRCNLKLEKHQFQEVLSHVVLPLTTTLESSIYNPSSWMRKLKLREGDNLLKKMRGQWKGICLYSKRCFCGANSDIVSKACCFLPFFQHFAHEDKIISPSPPDLLRPLLLVPQVLSLSGGCFSYW